MKKEKVSLDELKKSCKTLGLSFEDFIDKSDEIEKSADSSVNYKEMYRDQLEKNHLLLLEVGKIAIELPEILKGVSECKQMLNDLDITPAHAGKSYKNMNVVEKAFNYSDSQKNKAEKTLSNRVEIQKFLGEMQDREFERGVTNGFYGKAALKFDSYNSLPEDTIREIFEKDKVLITI